MLTGAGGRLTHYLITTSHPFPSLPWFPPALILDCAMTLHKDFAKTGQITDISRCRNLPARGATVVVARPR
jgi:hypothetical protein